MKEMRSSLTLINEPLVKKCLCFAIVDHFVGNVMMLPLFLQYLSHESHDAFVISHRK